MSALANTNFPIEFSLKEHMKFGRRSGASVAPMHEHYSMDAFQSFGKEEMQSTTDGFFYNPSARQNLLISYGKNIISSFLNLATTTTEAIPIAPALTQDTPPVGFVNYIDSITVHLERLSDGWAGPDCIAPPKRVIDDISRASVAMQQVSISPEIEVDEDGTVVLEWESNGRAFCLTFMGKGQVVGTLSPWSADYPAWRLPVEDEIAIAEKLEESCLAAFIGKK